MNSLETGIIKQYKELLDAEVRRSQNAIFIEGKLGKLLLQGKREIENQPGSGISFSLVIEEILNMLKRRREIERLERSLSCLLYFLTRPISDHINASTLAEMIKILVDYSKKYIISIPYMLRLVKPRFYLECDIEITPELLSKTNASREITLLFSGSVERLKTNNDREPLVKLVKPMKCFKYMIRSLAHDEDRLHKLIHDMSVYIYTLRQDNLYNVLKHITIGMAEASESLNKEEDTAEQDEKSELSLIRYYVRKILKLPDISDIERTALLVMVVRDGILEGLTDNAITIYNKFGKFSKAFEKLVNCPVVDFECIKTVVSDFANKAIKNLRSETTKVELGAGKEVKKGEVVVKNPPRIVLNQTQLNLF